MAIIYKITHKETNKAYIGASRQSLARVRRMHINEGKKYNGVPSPSINWHLKQEGVAGFSFEILKEVPNREQDYWEAYYIAHFNTFHEGYNTTIDGKPHTAYETQLMREGKWKPIVHPTITAMYLWYMKGIVLEDNE